MLAKNTKEFIEFFKEKVNQWCKEECWVARRGHGGQIEQLDT